MSKPYQDTEFSDQVINDRNWRLKEISDLKNAIQRADSNLQKVLLRSLVTICYAHWEGFVRFSARRYLEHVALRKFQYRQLDPQFLRNHFLPRLSAISNTQLNIEQRCSLIDSIFDGPEQRFSRVNEEIVSTRSNLNFDVFRDICRVCGIPIDPFLDSETFINILLLKRRNSIAHGEDTLVGIEDLDLISEETIALMRGFGDALENRVWLRSYMAA